MASENDPTISAGQALFQGVSEAVSAFVEGVGQVYDIAQASPTLNAWAEHGATELVSGMQTGNAWLPYGWGGSHGDSQSEQHLADQAFGDAPIQEAPAQEPSQGMSQS